MKLVLLTNILTPYRIPLFKAMAKAVDEFIVVLMVKNEENRQWEIGAPSFPVHILPGFHLRPRGADVSLHLNYGVSTLLRRLNPDAVMNAGFSLANMAAFVYCKRYHKPFIHWAHLSLQDGAHTSFLRRRIRHWLIGRSDGAIGESSHARNAFLHYGLAEDRVLTATMPLDVIQVHDEVLRCRQSAEYRRLRETYRSPILLSIGQIIKRKGYDELFAIYANVLRSAPDLTLLIVGDGVERERLQAEARQRGWNRVHFFGFVQSDCLPQYLALADAFIFHTLYDAFGLVLSEAMAAGLPVISSIHAFATHDLVEEGITGFRIDPRETESSSSTVLRVLSMAKERKVAIGQAAYRRILPCDATPTAANIVQFLRRVVGQAPRRSRASLKPDSHTLQE